MTIFVTSFLVAIATPSLFASNANALGNLSLGEKRTMTKLVFSVGPDSKHFVPKTKVCNSILGLRHEILISLFRGAKVFKRCTKSQLEAYRADWLEWLDKTPSVSFLSFHDAFWQYVNACDSGEWTRFQHCGALIASRTLESDRMASRVQASEENAANEGIGSLGELLKSAGIDPNQVTRNERALIGK